MQQNLPGSHAEAEQEQEQPLDVARHPCNLARGRDLYGAPVPVRPAGQQSHQEGGPE